MDEHIAAEPRQRAVREDTRPEPPCCPPHTSELVKNWASIAALVVAELWAVWNFWFKEFLQPRQVPVNISLNLEMRKIPLGAPGQGLAPLMAVELSVKATNPSTRNVYLLPSAWMARGYRVLPIQGRADFNELAGASIRANHIRPVEKYAAASNSEMVAAGRLFTDDELKPNETIVRRIVFHLPPGPFNVVEVYTCVPSTSEPAGLGIVWRFEGDAITWEMMRDGRSLKNSKGGGASHEDFQQSISRAAMSL